MKVEKPAWIWITSTNIILTICLLISNFFMFVSDHDITRVTINIPLLLLLFVLSALAGVFRSEKLLALLYGVTSLSISLGGAPNDISGSLFIFLSVFLFQKAIYFYYLSTLNIVAIFAKFIIFGNNISLMANVILFNIGSFVICYFIVMKGKFDE